MSKKLKKENSEQSERFIEAGNSVKKRTEAEFQRDFDVILSAPAGENRKQKRKRKE